jgi:hypothetical protein
MAKIHGLEWFVTSMFVLTLGHAVQKITTTITGNLYAFS